MGKTIAIFGSAGRVGRAAVRQAAERGHNVIALEREWPADAPDQKNITHRTADVLTDDLAPAIAGADVVLSCLGVGNDPATLLDPPPLYSDGTDRIASVMEARGPKRLIVISASFVDAKNRGPIWFKLPAMVGLYRIFDQMRVMEEKLAETTLDWTAVRPGWLMDGELTGDYVIQPDVIPEDLIRSRCEDVAHFMLNLAENGEWSRQTPAIAREEPDAYSSPAAVAHEMLG